MFKAKLIKEIAIETKNDKGVAAHVAGLIAKQAGANIQAGWALGENGKGHFSLITDNNSKVLDALKNEFPTIHELDVLAIETSDAVGEVAEVTELLHSSGLNIDSIYTTYMQNKPVIIIATDDNQKALSLFK